MTEKPPEPRFPEPSKSQRKRDAQELFALGRSLVELDARALQRLPLEPNLREAIDTARGIRSHIARKRQLQYIARLLRGTDADPIRAALDTMQMEARQITARHHRVEAWRDRLLAEGDLALQALMAGIGHAEARSLRQLVRNASREAQSGRPPASARKLFRLLRELDAEYTLPPP